MSIPQSVINEISDKASIVDIVTDYTTLKLSGGRYVGLCPFHTEKSPSFSVNEEKKVFYCFGCHKGGNLFQFLMEIEGMNFVEAVKYLGEKVGVEVVDDTEGWENDAQTALYELYARVSGSLHFLLTESSSGTEALTYLKDRGFSDEIIKDFNLGYAPADPRWMFDFLSRKGYTPDFLATSGLFSRRDPRYPLFRNRLIIPISSHQGRVVAFGGRLLAGEGPKYLNSPETAIYKKSRTLFGLDKALKTIRKEGQFFLCEGYMDVMALVQGGVNAAVAPLGTSFTLEQARMLKRYAGRGTILFDADAAGQAATEKAAFLCAEAGIESAVLLPAGGKDPAEILEKEGPGALHESLKYPINSFDYLVERAMRRYDITTPEGKQRVLTAISPFIETQDSEVKREAYLRRLSDVLEVNVTAITADLSQQLRATPRVHAEPEDPERLGSDLFLMLGAAAFPEHFVLVRQYINAESLEDRRARDLFIILEEAFRRDQLDMNSIVQKVDNEEIRALIIDKAFSGEFGPDPRVIIRDLLRRVRETSLEKQIVEISRRLRREERGGGTAQTLKELLSEKMYLTEELQKLRVRQA